MIPAKKILRALVCASTFGCAFLPPTIRAQDAIDRLDMQAHAAYDSQDYATAIKLWTNELKLDPTNATVAFNRASAYELSDQPDKAIDGYTEAIRLDPKDPQAHLSRAQLYARQWQAAATKGAAGDAKGAADDPDAQKMIADYTELIRLKPDADSYSDRAAAYRTLHQPDKAIADYNTMMQLDPKAWQPYQYRGATYFESGQWDKAVDDFTQVLKMNPGDDVAASTCLMRGTVYLQQKEWDKALDDATASLKVNPDNAEALSLRGNAEAGRGDYQKAIDDYHKLTAADPDYAEAYNAEAWLYATCPDEKFRNGTKALELAQKACELTQWKDVSFIDTLAAAYAENGKFDDAVKYQKQAVDASRTERDTEWMTADLASRIPLYEQKQPYREEKKQSNTTPPQTPAPSPH